MNILERKVENQVQFWSLLGPFIILLSTTVLLFKASSYWYLSLTTLIGIPLCLKWRLKGLATTLTFLLALLLSSYAQWELEERYWYVGMGMALAFSFVILTLSLEEVGGLLGKLQRESQSRLDNFLRLDEKMREVEQEWVTDQEALKTQIQTFTTELAQIQEEKLAFHKLVHLAKDELVTLRGQHEQVLDELLQKKQHITQLKEKIEEAEITIQGFVNGEAEKQLQQSMIRLVSCEKELQQVKDQTLLLESRLQQVNEERGDLIHQIQARSEQLTHYQKQAAYSEQEKERMAALIQSKEEKIEGIKKEKEHLGIALSNLRAEFDHLCQLEQQSKQENRHLIETIQKIQEAQAKEHELQTRLERYQEQLAQTEREYEELKGQKHDLEQEAQQWKSEYERSQQLLDTIKEQKVSLPYANGNTRQIETMYLQLKGQFQEKSAVLDATRRELFHTQEKLLSLQKEWEESHCFEPTENEILFQKHLKKVNQELENSHYEHQQEIDRLYQLVSHLMP